MIWAANDYIGANVATDVFIRYVLPASTTYISWKEFDLTGGNLATPVQEGPDRLIWYKERLQEYEYAYFCVTLQVDADFPVGAELMSIAWINTISPEVNYNNNEHAWIDYVGPLDFGDAPDPIAIWPGRYPTLVANNGARHVATGPTLGTNRDSDADGQPTANADGDDASGTPDDEDGVNFTSALIQGNTATVTVYVSDTGKLDAWIDFNRDGDWSDADEQIFGSLTMTTGYNYLTFTVPAGASQGTTYARFRLSTDGGLSPSKIAPDGEVEDYQVSILSNPPPTVISTDLQSSYMTGPASFTIAFSENVSTTGGSTGADSATNPANFLLLEEGALAGFQTTACNNVDLLNDAKISPISVSYDGSIFTAMINLNGGTALPGGTYRFFVCGTTSIEDLTGNKLAGDGINTGTDYKYDFTVRDASNTLPSTGFAVGRITRIPEQPASRAYASTDLMLDIPPLDLSMPIVGVPQSGDSWDVTWLGNNAGWLNGSAFPTWSGNTVITAHVWDAWNQPGPFAQLKTLKYGDQFHIHAWGLTHIYEVRENRVFWARTAATDVFRHEEHDWVTLLTCETYNPFNGEYFFRRVVRAVLISVTR